MAYGYCKKLLAVNLSDRSMTIIKPDDSFYRTYIGGEGIGVKYLLERCPQYADPLGFGNILGFCSGLLSGTGVPASSRITVVTKSPLTGTWGDSNAGGNFAVVLKQADLDGIFIHGQSSSPVYLHIEKNNYKIYDASHLWGCDTYSTVQSLLDGESVNNRSIACIGPAGENLSLISSIIINGRSAARSGVGAVMGSKKLKAVLVVGSQPISSANLNSVKSLKSRFVKKILQTDHFVIRTLRDTGTCGLVSLGTEFGIAPAKNWAGSGIGSFPNHPEINGTKIVENQISKEGCWGCPIGCGGFIDQAFSVSGKNRIRKPEYETLVSFGNQCLNDDLSSIYKAEDLCDRYGLDTISTGSTIAFAMECYKKGLLTEWNESGLDLSWGNSDAILRLIEAIAFRKDLGFLLADGVRAASQKLGKESEQFAIHIHGQEMPYHDFRYEMPGRGFFYLMDPTPARHERYSGAQILESDQPLGREAELQPPMHYESELIRRATCYAVGSQYYTFFSACGLCAFLMGVSSQLPLVDFVREVTGWDFSASELLKAGKTILSLKRFFNYREGIRTDDFTFPKRLNEPPSFPGPMRGETSEVSYERLKVEYFKLMGWDKQSGVPGDLFMQMHYQGGNNEKDKDFSRFGFC